MVLDHFVDNSDASSFGVSNELLPSFKVNISLSNPSTWHNLLFFLFEYFSQRSKFSFSISGVVQTFHFLQLKLIIPWKQKMAFGVSFEPFLNREVSS